VDPVAASFIALIFLRLIMEFSLIYEGSIPWVVLSAISRDSTYSRARRGEDWVSTAQKDVVCTFDIVNISDIVYSSPLFNIGGVWQQETQRDNKPAEIMWHRRVAKTICAQVCQVARRAIRYLSWALKTKARCRYTSWR